MRLVLLRGLHDSVGYVEAGQELEVSEREGRALIASGYAEQRPTSGPSARPGWAEWVVLASGPSLVKEDVAAVLRWRLSNGRRRVIVVNTTFRMAPWADILYAADLPWWDTHHEEVEQRFEGQCWSQTEIACRTYGLAYIRGERRPGLSKQRGVIHQGGNSGYQAIGLAVDQGAERIVLLGFDMQNTDGRTHWHGDHPLGLRNASPFASWIGNFVKLAEDLRAAEVEVVNATRQTALACFERMPLDKALA